MLITKQEYDTISRSEKEVLAGGIHRKYLEKDKDKIIKLLEEFITVGVDPKQIVVVIAGRYEPFWSDVWRRNYAGDVLMDILSRKLVLDICDATRFDPESTTGSMLVAQASQYGFVLPSKGEPLYLDVANNLREMAPAEDQIPIVIISHGAGSVVPLSIDPEWVKSLRSSLPIEPITDSSQPISEPVAEPKKPGFWAWVFGKVRGLLSGQPVS